MSSLCDRVAFAALMGYPDFSGGGRECSREWVLGGGINKLVLTICTSPQRDIRGASGLPDYRIGHFHTFLVEVY